MQFHGGAAVFQFVGLFDRGERQLALFADRHEADVELIGHHGAQNEATGIQPGHHIGPQVLVHVAVHESINQHAKHLGVLQQRGDVAELHAWSRPVGNGADVLAEVVVDTERLHGDPGAMKLNRLSWVYPGRASAIRCRALQVQRAQRGARTHNHPQRPCSRGRCSGVSHPMDEGMPCPFLFC